MKAVLSVAVCILYFGLFPAYAAGPVINEEDVIKQIRAKYTPLFSKYQGIESVCEFSIRVVDLRSNKEVGTSFVVLQQKDFYYKVPESRAIRYVEDGKEKKPSDYKPGSIPPAYQVFDEQHDLHYAVNISGKTRIEGQDCYELIIIPKEKTERHMSGRAYVTQSGLDLIYFEGTIAKLPFGLQSFSMKLYFTRFGEASVMSRALYDLVINIPVLYPDKHIISSGVYKPVRMIPR